MTTVIITGGLIIIGYLTSYVVTMYSLAVYIDPDEVDHLFPNIPRSKQQFLVSMAADPRLFRQIAMVYRSFALLVIAVSTVHLFEHFVPVTFVERPYFYPLIVVVLWLVHLVFAEYLPRRASRKAINRGLVRHFWMIKIVYYIFFPIVNMYRGALRRIHKQEQVTEEEKDELVERAIEMLAEEAGIGEPIVEKNEKEMIGQIFLLDQTVVREIMVPRPDVVGIDRDMQFKDIQKLVLEDGHSRYPVYEGSVDKIIGMLYVKDLFSKMPEPGQKFVIDKYLRKPYFVPETKIIGELLTEFKTRRLHIAVVVDEYGGVAGLVTLEDIIEEIFGEIRDEHDLERDEFTKLADGSYLVSAGMLVEKLQDELETDYEQGDIDTVGGLIYSLVGSVPSEGQQVSWNDLDFQVEKVEGQRIRLLRVRK